MVATEVLFTENCTFDTFPFVAVVAAVNVTLEPILTEGLLGFSVTLQVGFGTGVGVGVRVGVGVGLGRGVNVGVAPGVVGLGVGVGVEFGLRLGAGVGVGPAIRKRLQALQADGGH